MLLKQYVFNDFENLLYFSVLSIVSEILYNDTISKALCNIVII